MSSVIYSSGIPSYRNVSEKIKSDPNIQAEIVPTNKMLEERNTQYAEENKQTQDNPLSEKKLLKMIEEVNKKIESYDKRLEYSIHERTNRLLVKVIDTQTDRVIKEIPNEKLMDMMADLCEASGILIDEKI